MNPYMLPGEPDGRDLAWLENMEDALDALEGWAVSDYLDRHPRGTAERNAFLWRLEMIAGRCDGLTIKADTAS